MFGRKKKAVQIVADLPLPINRNEAFLRTMWHPGQQVMNGLGAIDAKGNYTSGGRSLTMTRPDGTRKVFTDEHPDGIELDR